MDELTRLAVAAGNGNQIALAAVVRATQGDVWRLCAHLVDPGSADDLTQETYLRAVRQLKRFRGEGPVRSWLLTIARRSCATEIAARQRRRDTALDLRAHQHPSIGDHTLQVELQMLLDTLEPDRRAAFVLTQILDAATRRRPRSAAARSAPCARAWRAPGTRYFSCYQPQEMLTLAGEAGFADVRHVSGASSLHSCDDSPGRLIAAARGGAMPV